VKTTVEPLEGNKVKVSVSVDETEFDKAIDAAFKKLAQEVRIPGFRPGKAPRKVLEKRLGPEVGRGQALHDSLPEFYAQAVKENDVDVIAAPELEITEGEEEGPVTFEAVVEIRPIVQVPGYGSLRITVDPPEATDEEVDEQIERLRSQFGELTAVERPVQEGDFVTIDVAGSQDGEPIDQLTAEDYLYEVGSGGILPEVDEQLLDAEAGAVLEFEAAFPGYSPSEDDEDDDGPPSLDFVVTVKEVKEKILPELDDAFADDASEFATLAELRGDIANRITLVKRGQGQMQLREKTGEALGALVEDDVPEALISTEVQQRLQDLQMRLQAQGLDLETWIQMSGQSPDTIIEELKDTAEQAVRVDLALRAVVEAEAIDCTDEELEQEFAQVAERLNMKAKEVRKQFERADQVGAVRSDIKKRKAFDWLLERVEIVDADGNPLDRAAFEADESDDEAPDQGADAGGDTGVIEASDSTDPEDPPADPTGEDADENEDHE
jgi:trigger factor